MAFPATSVIDAFTRADSSSAIGGAWVITGFSNGGISTNQAYNPSTGDGLVAYQPWNYGPDCECYVKFPTFSSATYYIYARATTTTLGSETTYAIRWLSSTSTAICRIDAGVVTVLASGFFSMANGYGLGIEVLGRGSTVTINCHQFNGTSWSQILTTTDASGSRITAAGKVGFSFPADTTFRADDFGGGSLVFLNTAVLDNFNRADNTDIGANWNKPSYTTSDAPQIVSNRFAPIVTTSRASDGAWATAFSANQEAFCDIGAVDSGNTDDYVNVDVLLNNLNTASITAYELAIEDNSTWKIYRVDAGSFVQLGATLTQALAGGDAVGIVRNSSTGDTDGYYRPSGSGSWAWMMTRNDTTYTSGGQIGCGVNRLWTLDNFGGGNSASAPVIYAPRLMLLGVG